MNIQTRPEIEKQRDILDRRALTQALTDAVAGSRDPHGDTAAVGAILREHLAQGRAEIKRRFDADPRAAESGRRLARETCFMTDQLIRAIYDFTTTQLYPLANPSAAEKVALVAVGGYGRAELAPYSDIDLLFLLPYKLTPHCEQVVEYILYRLWDLGLKVGQSTRSIDECLARAKDDLTILTALLEARYLWGEQELFDKFRKRFHKECVAGQGEAFYQAKLNERKQRHEKFGPSRYALEPNIKEGKGGLRDLQTLRWIGRFLYSADTIDKLVEQGVLTADAAYRFDKAEAYLWVLRCHLHFLRGRAEEKLTFDIQLEIARRLGYRDHAGNNAVERLMKHYFLTAKSVGELTRFFCTAVEAQHVKRSFIRLPSIGLRKRELEGFGLDGGRLSVPNARHFDKSPLDLLRIFRVAQKHDLDIQPMTFTWIADKAKLIDKAYRENPEANAIFMKILTSRSKGPETAARRMNEAGVFGRFIPDFGRVVAQMQFDMYHHFTVDEHTIYALGILHKIETGGLSEETPISTRVVHEIQSRRVLYVAVLLHDIAKGRSGDHSVLGAEIADQLCPRLGFTEDQTETVAWLVRHHLLMSNTAFKRDLDDPATIETFADQVQSMERLRQLLVLTVADIRAVGPKTWNGWKAQLLRDLFNRTEEYLSGGLIFAGREREVDKVLGELRAKLADWPAADIDAHLERGHPGYWLSFPAPILERHARLVREAELDGRALSVDFRVDPWESMTEVTIYVPDRVGLVSQLAGACALSGASIVEARIFTLKNGKALDVFAIQDSEGGPFDQPTRLARLTATIERVLGAPEQTLAALKTLPPHVNPKTSAFPVAPRVLVDNKASAAYTLIEITGRDRRGLVHALTSVLSEQDLRIANAKISTFGHRAVDTFYVKDRFGLKIEAEPKLKAIRAALLDVLAEGRDQVSDVRYQKASG
jgi:[protein-PII] uridylyltransferase